MYTKLVQYFVDPSNVLYNAAVCGMVLFRNVFWNGLYLFHDTKLHEALDRPILNICFPLYQPGFFRK